MIKQVLEELQKCYGTLIGGSWGPEVDLNHYWRSRTNIKEFLQRRVETENFGKILDFKNTFDEQCLTKFGLRTPTNQNIHFDMLKKPKMYGFYKSLPPPLKAHEVSRFLPFFRPFFNQNRS